MRGRTRPKVLAVQDRVGVNRVGGQFGRLHRLGGDGKFGGHAAEWESPSTGYHIMRLDRDHDIGFGAAPDGRVGSCLFKQAAPSASV